MGGKPGKPLFLPLVRDDNWWNDHRGYKVDHDNTDCSRPVARECLDKASRSKEQVVVSTETDENGGVRVRVVIGGWFVIGNAGASVRGNHTAHRRFD